MCLCAVELMAMTEQMVTNNEIAACQHQSYIEWQATQTALYHCELSRKNNVDVVSLILAGVMYAIYDEYYDKYEDVLEWRNEISLRIKDCLNADIDHYKDVVMANMSAVINALLDAPKILVDYDGIVGDYNDYATRTAGSAVDLIDELNRKTCFKSKITCDHKEGDIQGWAIEGAVNAADANMRFDEGRVPRRLETISSSLANAHSSTFNLPNFDYQALGFASNIAGSLASIYSGILNSALGSFGYFGSNFINSLGGN